MVPKSLRKLMIETHEQLYDKVEKLGDRELHKYVNYTERFRESKRERESEIERRRRKRERGRRRIRMKKWSKKFKKFND